MTSRALIQGFFIGLGIYAACGLFLEGGCDPSTTKGCGKSVWKARIEEKMNGESQKKKEFERRNQVTD